MSIRAQLTAIAFLFTASAVIVALGIAALEPIWVAEKIGAIENKYFSLFWGSIAVIECLIALSVITQWKKQATKEDIWDRMNRVRLLGGSVAIGIIAAWVWYIGPPP